MGTGPRVAAGTITLDLNQTEQVFFSLMDLSVGVLFGFFCFVFVECRGKEHIVRAQPGTSLKVEHP